jgi:UDP:flavonoid glycosyltransferase YjiC (YdhE family)
MMVSLPMRGHIVPIVRLASELNFRGHTVSVAVQPEAQEYVLQAGVQFIPLRLPFSSDDRKSALQVISYDTSFFRGILNLLNEVYLPNAQPLFAALSAIVKKVKPDMLIIDIGALGAIEVAHLYKIPFIINNPSLAFRLDAVPHNVPAWGSGFSQHMSLFSRCLSLIYPRLLAVAFTPTFMDINKLRRQYSLPLYKTQQEMYGNSLVMVNSAPGFDYPSLTYPLTKFVGPLLPTISPTLPPSLAQWLDNSNKPVIVVLTGEGSMSFFEPWQIKRIAAALADMRFRVLWALRTDLQHIIGSSIPATFRVKTNLPQLPVIAHHSVKVIISPCSISTTQEALFYGRTVLCIPVLGDQADVAARVVDAGVGIVMDKLKLDSAEISKNIVMLYRNVTYLENAQKVGTILRAAGGTHAAADLVEFTLTSGINHLLSMQNSLPWHEVQQLDTYALLFAFFCMVIVLLRFLGLCIVLSFSYLSFSKQFQATSIESATGTPADTT